MQKIIKLCIILFLSSCGSTNYNALSTEQLDSMYCNNGWCQFQIAKAYFNRNDVQKGWGHMNISARMGYQPAQNFYINMHQPVPIAD